MEKLVKQPYNNQAHFSDVPFADIERSTFDRSHAAKGTIEQAGQLVPVMWDEVLPGDTFNINATVFTRLATPLKPFMDNLKIDVHWFFVPNRLVWENWQRFMGERRGPDDDPGNYTIPQAPIDLTQTAAYGSQADHLGLPIGQPQLTPQSVSALPFRAYQLIYYEWYRDENIEEDAILVDIGDGPDTNLTGADLRIRNKRKDYFTSALPWPQKGDPVVIPLGETAPLVVTGTGEPTVRFTDPTGGGSNHGSSQRLGLKPGGDQSAIDAEFATEGSNFSSMYWIDPALEADLASATATSINDLRTAFQIQRLLERDARGGTRYIELILSHFGVQSDDARLQRPEYLGAGSGHINVNPIASTYADQTESIPQGNLSGVGTGICKSGFSHSFTEHGMVMGIMSIQSDLTYQNGVDRAWSRQTRYDFYWPALSHLGEQAILQKEIYATGEDAKDNVIFGYQERYAEYRYKPSRVTGLFRSNHPQSLDVWHLAQDFDTAPTLNGGFLKEVPPIDRVIAVPGEPHFIYDAWISMTCTRPMPVYSVPGMIDHF